MYVVLLRDRFDCSVKFKTWIYGLRIKKNKCKKNNKYIKRRKRKMEREEKRWGEQNFLLYFRKCKCIIFKYFKY